MCFAYLCSISGPNLYKDERVREDVHIQVKEIDLCAQTIFSAYCIHVSECTIQKFYFLKLSTRDMKMQNIFLCIHMIFS